MTDLTKYDLPFSGLEKQLIAWSAEALEYRFGQLEEGKAPTLPPAQADQKETLESLLLVRRRLDRVETILASLTHARGRVSRASQVAKNQAEDDWNEASVADRSSSVKRGGEFVAPKERYADFTLATMQQQRDARQAARLLSVADEAAEVVRLCYRGLNDLRQDHLALLRALSFESHLERSTPDKGF